MDTTWILVADSGRARIFEKHNHAAITELQDLTNSLGRLQDRELKTDKEGRFFGRPAQGNTSEPDVSPEPMKLYSSQKQLTNFSVTVATISVFPNCN